MTCSSVEKRIKPAFKLWFEIGDNYVFGEGTYKLLEQIERKRSISAAARATSMSYRHAWNLIKDVEKHLGEPVIETRKGGKDGGGADLVHAGMKLLKSYRKLRMKMESICILTDNSDS